MCGIMAHTMELHVYHMLFINHLAERFSSCARNGVRKWNQPLIYRFFFLCNSTKAQYVECESLTGCWCCFPFVLIHIHTCIHSQRSHTCDEDHARYSLSWNNNNLRCKCSSKIHPNKSFRWETRNLYVMRQILFIMQFVFYLGFRFRLPSHSSYVPLLCGKMLALSESFMIENGVSFWLKAHPPSKTTHRKTTFEPNVEHLSFKVLSFK